YALFKVEPTRSGNVLLEVLGQEFNGVLGCDYFSAYRRYLRECDVVVQFCLAHLIRDVKFLTMLPDGRDRAYGERLREAPRSLFGVIHRREVLGPRVFQRQLRAARDELFEERHKTPRYPGFYADETHDAPLPNACPDCGGSVCETEVAPQFQAEIPRRPIIRQF